MKELIIRLINFLGSDPDAAMIAINNLASLPLRNFLGESWSITIAFLTFFAIVLAVTSCRVGGMRISNPSLQIRTIKFLSASLMMPLAIIIFFAIVFWLVNLLTVTIHTDGHLFADKFYDAFIITAIFAAVGVAVGISCWWLVGVYLEPWLSKKFALKFDADGLSDIRELSETFFPNVNFEKAAQASKDVGDVMLGIDEKGKSIGINFKEFCSKNFQVVGAPGSGKGVFAQQIFAQIYGFVISIVFDPKCDPYLTAFFQKKGSCYFLDLRDSAPQINLFKDCSKTEVADALVDGVRCRETGDLSDVYKIEEAEAIEQLIDQVPDFETETIASIATEQFSDARKLASRLRSISRIAALKGDKSLLEILKKHKGLYIIFDESSEIQKLVARIFYSRIQQLKKSKKIKSHITILADEFFHLVSKTVVDSLGLMRSRGCNAICCHQSLGDFIGQFGDVDPKAAKQRTLDNTHIKIIYRQQQDAVDWSLQTGKKVFEDVMRESAKSDVGADLEGSKGRISIKQRPTIDENEFLSLGKSVAVLIGHGVAKKIKTIPPKVDLVDFKIKPCPQTPQQNENPAKQKTAFQIEGDTL